MHSSQSNSATLLSVRVIKELKNYIFNRFSCGATTAEELLPDRRTERLLRKLFPYSENVRARLYFALMKELRAIEPIDRKRLHVFVSNIETISLKPLKEKEEAVERLIHVEKLETAHRFDSSLEKKFVRVLLCLSPYVKVKTNVEIEGMRNRGVFHRFDVLIPSKRTAFEIDGCYWHGCPEHYPNPTKNQLLSRQKDTLISAATASIGWQLERFWEHEFERVESLGERLATLLGVRSVERFRAMLDTLSGNELRAAVPIQTATRHKTGEQVQTPFQPAV